MHHVPCRFCEYPQELVLRLERTSEVKQIQILSHQAKIATRIEIAIGSSSPDDADSDYTQAKFKRLGYMSEARVTCLLLVLVQSVADA